MRQYLFQGQDLVEHPHPVHLRRVLPAGRQDRRRKDDRLFLRSDPSADLIAERRNDATGTVSEYVYVDGQRLARIDSPFSSPFYRWV